MIAASTVKRQKILIVDDMPSNLEIISNYLGNAGFEAMVAQDGESGIEIARRTQPDLILLDVQMPGIDGFETCRRLKSDSEVDTIPVIFLTALTEKELILKGFQVGGADYITKPVRIDEVLARVKTHVALRAFQVELANQNVQLQEEVSVRLRAEEGLRTMQTELERRVEERTEELNAEVNERREAQDGLQVLNRELALLNRVIAASVNESRAETVLDVVCRELARTFRVDHVGAMLLNDSEKEVIVAAEYSGGSVLSILEKTLLISDVPSLQKILTNGNVLVVENVETDPLLISLHHFYSQQNVASILCVPLMLNDDRFGYLQLASRERRYFSSAEIDLAESVAKQVAGVLKRLRLDMERRNLETQYFQAQKMDALGKLTGGVAHDFNNILTVVLGNCDLLLLGLDASAQGLSEVEQIRKAAQHAAGLTRQLLAFSRKQFLQPVVLDLNEIADNVKKMLLRLIGEDIHLKTILAPDLGLVKADAGQIEQVLMNLAVNARDAMVDGGKLTIETANVFLDKAYSGKRVEPVAGDYIMLAISDTGMGMDSETQARIFEPFFTTKEQGKGTGLGLATVHGIVNQSGGHIVVHSAPKNGTTFKIYLPRVTASGERARPKPSSVKIEGGSETILLVEDDANVRKVISMLLVREGYTVFEADDCEKARRHCLDIAGSIHLMLTDVVIPGGKKSPQLAKELLLLHPEMRVLYISGYTDNVIVHSGALDEGIAFLAKPFSKNELVSKVREVLDKVEL